MRSPVEHTISLRNIDMHYYEWGDRGAPIVLLAHATGFHARCWDETVRALGDGHCAIAMDQRGHGRSSKTGPYGWAEFGADLTAFVEALDLDDIIGVGHSMGGHVTVQAALDLPERFRRLVLVDPVMLEPAAYAVREQTIASPGEHPVARRKNQWGSWQEVYERFKSREPFSLWQDAALRDYARYAVVANPDGDGFVLACPPRVEAAIYMGSAGTDLTPRLGGVVLPVTVLRAFQPDVRGDEMDFAASPTWNAVADAFPNARDVYLPELTHFIPMQRPDIVARAIAEVDT